MKTEKLENRYNENVLGTRRNSYPPDRWRLSHHRHIHVKYQPSNRISCPHIMPAYHARISCPLDRPHGGP